MKELKYLEKLVKEGRLKYFHIIYIDETRTPGSLDASPAGYQAKAVLDNDREVVGHHRHGNRQVFWKGTSVEIAQSWAETLEESIIHLVNALKPVL